MIPDEVSFANASVPPTRALKRLLDTYESYEKIPNILQGGAE